MLDKVSDVRSRRLIYWSLRPPSFSVAGSSSQSGREEAGECRLVSQLSRGQNVCQHPEEASVPPEEAGECRLVSALMMTSGDVGVVTNGCGLFLGGKWGGL